MTSDEPRFALSIRSPWWWFILHGGKDIENRDWPTKVRGRVYIHASKWFVRSQVIDDWTFAHKHVSASGRAIWPGINNVKAHGGHIVGTVEVIDCVTESDSPWFFGKYGFVQRDPQFIKPIPCKGALGFFKPSLTSTKAA